MRDDGRVRGTRQAHADGVPGAGDPPRPGSDTPGLGRALAVVALLAVAVLATGLTGPWSPEFTDAGRVTVPLPLDQPAPEAPATPTVEAVPETPASQPELSAPWLRPVLTTATLLAVALLVLHLVRRLRPQDEVPAEDPAPDPAGAGAPGVQDRNPTVHAMRDGVAAAAEHLRSPARPVDAVIAAWVRLEEAAAASGLARHPASTPTEFTLAVLDRTHADRAASRDLLDLYLRARFGEEHLGADDVAAARRAVDLLAAGLTDPAEGGPP